MYLGIEEITNATKKHNGQRQKEVIRHLGLEVGKTKRGRQPGGENIGKG